MSKRIYKGKSGQPVELTEITNSGQEVEATVSYGDKRLVFQGKATIDSTKGSFKWGEQIQLALWTTQPIQEEDRADNKGYSRIEIAIPRSVALNMFAKLSLLLFQQEGADLGEGE